jgi:hypothetical protein
MDDRRTLRRLLPELETHLDETGVPQYEIASFYFHLGENDKGFDWLEKSYSSGEGDLLGLKVDPDLDGIHTDPRYLDLLKKLGLD